MNKYIFDLSREVTIEEIVEVRAENKLQALQFLEDDEDVTVLDWEQFGDRNRSHVVRTEVYDEDGLPLDESL